MKQLLTPGFTCLVTALCFVPLPASGAEKCPNLIFVLADDLGYGDLGCYGQKLIQTPRLDEMAAEGMRFTDFYAGATACDLAGIDTPPGTDSISFLPTLLGQSERQQEHDYLYWEFYEGDSSQAVRWDNWKAIRQPMLTGRIEIYDLVRDPAERYNLARRRDLVEQARKIMAEAHVAHPNWEVPSPHSP
jgi:arylsulfatase A-like enzyme